MREEYSPSRRRGSGSGGIRSLIEPRFLSPFGFNDGGRRSSYLKLHPQPLIKLSVVKLDGSLFDVEIGKDYTVSELKRAVEKVFIIYPQEGHARISWSHVWGHFCLCYGDQKLVSDKTSIRNLGLKDGDQLYFARHVSLDHSPMNKNSKSHSCKRYLKLEAEPVPRSQSNEAEKRSYSEAQDELLAAESGLVHLIKGWLPFAGHWGVTRKVPESSTRPSRFSFMHFGGRPNM